MYSNSPYDSSLVLVRKKNGRLRVCVDYRRLNKTAVPGRYPIPRIDELIDTIGHRKGRFFCALDLFFMGTIRSKWRNILSAKLHSHVIEDCFNTGECPLASHICMIY